LILLESDQYESAIKDLSIAYKLDPTDWESIKRRAVCYAHLHQYSDAIADYSTVIQLIPSDGVAYADRAVVYEKSGNVSAAKQDRVRAAKQGCPEGSQQLVARVRLMYYDGKFQAANQALTSIEQRGCCLFDLYAIRGRCRLAEEAFEYAAADFTRALQIHPHDLSLYVLRARAYLNMEKFESALTDCTNVIKLEPRYLMTRVVLPAGKPKKINVLFEAYRERIEAYRALGYFDKALDDCNAS
jgi:Flp pilus assembly protein TadD